MKNRGQRPPNVSAYIVRALIFASAAFTIGSMLFTVGFIAAHGIPNLRPELFSPKYTSENASMLPALVNTFYITFLSLAAAVPAGVFAAVYLAEYAKKGSCAVKLIRLASQTLAGIPSVIYGLFGTLAFVTELNWGYSLLSGAVTLALMVLPTIMSTAEEAVAAVPDSYREGSFGLGAGKTRTVFKIVLPSALPGIFSGIILAAGRITGESAALIFTAGTFAAVPKSLFGSARTLSVHLYCLLSEGMYTKQAYATAAVLLAFSAAINALASPAQKKLSRSFGNEV